MHWTQTGVILFPSNYSETNLNNNTNNTNNTIYRQEQSTWGSAENSGRAPWDDIPVPVLDFFVWLQVVWLIAAR